MDKQTVIFAIVVLSVAAIAYFLGGRRGRREPPAPGAAPDAPPPRARPLAMAAPSVATADSGPTLEVTATDDDATSDLDETPVVPPVSRADDEDGIARLDYEEDDEVEPTMVGKAASAPPLPRAVHQAPLKQVLIDADAGTDEPPRADPVFLVSATAQTDKGLRRKRNEDCLGVLEAKNLFIVADGMGGYAGGEQASKLAVATIIEAFRSDDFEGAPHADVPVEASGLARAIQMANATIGEEALKDRALTGMGTTVCAAVFSPNKRRLYIGHVGDSRCYRLRDGVFKPITADHTMFELGVKGPEGQQLSRAVGIWPTVTIDIGMAVPRTGDVYLLCSDGLTKMLSDELIGNVLRNEEDPKVAVERLIFFANARGGKDNITVVLVRVVPTDWKPKPSEPFNMASAPPPSSSDAPMSKGPPAGASGRHRVVPPKKNE